jgi:hypothetical protein
MRDMTIFGLEKLEDRLLLAVDVSLSGNTLHVTSDGASDAVAIFEYDGEIYVVVDEDDDGSFDFFEVYDADDIKHIKINMNGGDDYVGISGLELDGNITADMGSGDDEFDLEYGAGFAFDAADYATGDGDDAYGQNEIGGHVNVKGGSGDDTLEVEDSLIAKNVTIDAGDGDDDVDIGAYEADTFIGGNTKIILGSGDNDVDIEAEDDYDLDFGGNVDIKGGSDDEDIEIDVYGASEITFHKQLKIDLGGGGYDELDIDAYDDGEIDFFGNVSIKGAADDSNIEVENYSNEDITFHKQVKIDLQQGGDSYVHIYAEDDGEIEFDGNVQFKGGDGDDYVYIYAQDGDVVFNGNVNLDGKAGDNEILLKEDSADVIFNGDLKVKNFVYV